jgi:hypothetical protein
MLTSFALYLCMYRRYLGKGNFSRFGGGGNSSSVVGEFKLEFNIGGVVVMVEVCGLPARTSILKMAYNRYMKMFKVIQRR